MVVFHAHGCYSECLVQQSGWTRNVDLFLQWLSDLSFSGGGFSEVAIADGLSQGLMMFPIMLNGKQNVDGNMHCILIAAGNPHPVPMPVYRPKIQNIEQSEKIEVKTEVCFVEAETFAESFAKYSISLSVISPKQFPKLRAIYNAGKRNPHAAGPSINDVKNPYFLILLSEDFMEAHNALNLPGPTILPSNQTPLKTDATSVPSAAGQAPLSPVSSVNGSLMNRPPVPAGNLPIGQVSSASLAGGNCVGLRTVGGTPVVMHMSNKVSGGMVLSGLPTGQCVFSSGQLDSISMAGSGSLVVTRQVTQSTSLRSFATAPSNISGDSNLCVTQPLANLQGVSSIDQSVPRINSLSGAQIGQSGIGINQNVMNNRGKSISSEAGTMIPSPGISQQSQGGMQSIGVSNNSTANMPQAKYVKIWEGALSGERNGQPVFITKLEGYRKASTPEKLAADWPPMLQIVRIISQDQIKNKQFVSQAELFVFRALNQHRLLEELQEQERCAVIQLPSQILMTWVSDKPNRLIGMVLPGDVVFEPLLPSQQQQQQ